MNVRNLYELVWTTPIKEICKEHDIDYLAFRKLCTENNIPLPELGYWTKLRFGKPVTKIALSDKVNKSKLINLSELKKSKRNAEIKPQIIIPKKLHPLVSRAKKDLNITKSYTDAVGRMKWDRQKNVLPIHTDQKIQKRALSFMNTFLYNMEQRGMKIKFEYGRCNVELYNQTIEINLRQKYHRIRTTNDIGWSTHEFVKSNKLEFLTGYHARKGWLDSDKVKIEEQIPKILDYIEKDLTYWRDVRKQQADEEKLKEIELLKHQEIERLQKIEEDKKTQLYSDAENWQRAELLRKFLEAKKEDAISNGKISKETDEWMEWVTSIINELDPLI